MNENDETNKKDIHIHCAQKVRSHSLYSLFPSCKNTLFRVGNLWRTIPKNSDQIRLEMFLT